MPRQRKPIKMPGLNRPHPWRDGEDPIPCFTPKPLPQDGDAVSPKLGWADESAAPGDYAEIVRRAASAPSTTVHTMTVEAQGDWSSILSAARDGDPVPDELDDAGISLDYDPVEICSATFAEILGEELYGEDPVEIDVDEDLPSVTIGTFTFTISTTIRGGAERLARALHALGEALRHNAAEADPCPTCIAEPCACIAEEEE